MHRLSIPKKPEEYVIKYDKEITSDMQYEFNITYCIYTGNLIREIENRMTKKLVLSAEKAQRQEEILHNKVVRTYNRLYTELRSIGASPLSIYVEIEKRMK